MKKKSGSVKWFNEEKGYGFIYTDGEEDHYFTVKSIIGPDLPMKGDEVKFISSKGNRGFEAKKVEITAFFDEEIDDHKMECSNCGKQIVPRLVTYRGTPEKSICPFCGSTVKWFMQFFIMRFINLALFGGLVAYLLSLM